MSPLLLPKDWPFALAKKNNHAILCPIYMDIWVQQKLSKFLLPGFLSTLFGRIGWWRRSSF